MSEAHTLRINGTSLHADTAGVLIWPERRTLIVSDLHLEKGSSYHGRSRQFLPPYDSTATLARLADVLTKHKPERVICLGDSFHDGDAAARLDSNARQRINDMTAAHDWIWITGNHDPAPPKDMGGTVESEVVMNGLVFRHEARGDASAGEISGHYHPKARVRVRGRRLSAPCFASDGRRLVMPAFGSYTGGLNVLNPAIRTLFSNALAAHLLGKRGVYRYPQANLIG